MKCMVTSMMICLGANSLYAAEKTYITETEFANKLSTITKIEADFQTLVDSQQALTREKAATMIVDYLGYEALSHDLKGNTNFKDVESSKGEIALISQLGIMNGMGNQLFGPNECLTEEAANSILNRLQSKLQTQSNWKHACYAISSSSQMDWIKDYSAISFGWAQVFHQEDKFVVANDLGDFKVPSGFEKPMDEAKANGVETYLMVYFDGKDVQALLNNVAQSERVINQIVTLTNGTTKDGVTRAFDGVTIDFESLADSSLKAPYVNFLKQLKSALTLQNKKLNVAVQPTLYYKGYDYKGIGEVADRVILMAHDYGARSLNEQEQQAGITTTPLTPIDDVYAALWEAKNAIGDTNKIALQFSFASIQWQKQNGMVLNNKAYTPTYDKIAARLQSAGTQVKFDAYYQSTYATYEENGISNTIWYEDVKSIKAKMELAKLLGINNFSYWRLGMIPNEIKNLNYLRQ